MPEPKDEIGAAPVQRKLKSRVFLPAGLGVLFGCWFLWHNFSTHSALHELKAKLRQQGYPINFAEFDEWYAAVRPEENGALIYSQAFTNLVHADSPEGPGVFYSLSTNLLNNPGLLGQNREVHLQVSNVVASNAAALRILHEAMSFERSRYPIDLKQGRTLLLPHLTPIDASARLLFLEAHERIFNHDQSEAVRSIRAILALGNSLATEPIARSQGLRSFCNRFAVETTQSLLRAGRVEGENLKLLGDAFQKVEASSEITGAFLGELCVGLGLKQKDVLRLINQGEEGLRQNLSDELGSLLLALTDREKPDKIFFCERMIRYLQASRNSYPLRFEMIPKVDTMYPLMKRRGYFISMYVLLKQDPILWTDAENTARLRVIQAVLAVERYRLEHDGTLPLSLQTLVPRYLSTTVQDPFDGRPLRFKFLPKGYEVYSIGKDLKDNGGEAMRHWQNWDTQFDIGVTIERPLIP